MPVNSAVQLHFHMLLSNDAAEAKVIDEKTCVINQKLNISSNR